jgi:dTDP-4-dehydrorhamnose reductase
VNVVLIADEGALFQALCARLNERQRRYQIRLYQDILAVPPLVPSIIVDTRSRYLIHTEKQSSYPFDDFSRMVELCKQYGHAYFLSSDAMVFDGSDGKRFQEGDEPKPASDVGIALYQREKLLQTTLEKYLILRLGLLFSESGHHGVLSLMERFRQSKTLPLNNFELHCPTHVRDAARVIAAILDQLCCDASTWGTYHYSSADPVTDYEFSEVILAAASQYWDLSEVELQRSDIFTPRQPVLNCQKIRDWYGIKQLPWRAFVSATLRSLYESGDVKWPKTSEIKNQLMNSLFLF